MIVRNKVPFFVSNDILEKLAGQIAGIDNSNKIPIAFSFCQSIPFVNANFHCLERQTILNSLATANYSAYTLNHAGQVIGNIIGLYVFDENETPMRVYGIGTIFKESLNDLGIDPDELVNLSCSWEILFNPKECGFYNSTVIIPFHEAPKSWQRDIEEIINGKPIYDTFHHRISIVLGGVNGKVSFVGNSLLIGQNPADSSANILLAAASKKELIFNPHFPGDAFTDYYNNKLKNNPFL